MPTKPTPINPEAIRLEAQKAAWIYDTVIQACPYPWGTEAANIFVREFDLAKDAQEAAGAPAPKVPAPQHNKTKGTYTAPTGTYCRNTGNGHVPSHGLGC